MKTFLKLPAEERQLAFQQVVGEMGLQAVSVEKDFWVCWTLRELFSMPGVREHLTFKGGTSLSKVWKFIERFSEDIDIIVDKVALGFGGDAAPDRAPSKKQRRERLEKLMEASRQWVQGTLQPALDARLRETLGEAGWRLEVDPDLADGQCLLFHYPALFTATAAGYVRPVVKIELGARSDDWPHETKVIQPYVIEFFPAFDPDATFSVNVLAAERTFWEKVTLLHAENHRPDPGKLKPRMSRHWSDVAAMSIGDSFTDQELSLDLLRQVIEFKKTYFASGWAHYETAVPGTLRIVPNQALEKILRHDYDQMKEMFWGAPVSFDEVLAQLNALEHRINSLK